MIFQVERAVDVHLSLRSPGPSSIPTKNPICDWERAENFRWGDVRIRKGRDEIDVDSLSREHILEVVLPTILHTCLAKVEGSSIERALVLLVFDETTWDSFHSF
jgi:hypothetical protein